MLKFVPPIPPPSATSPDLPATTDSFSWPGRDQLKPTTALSRLRPVKLEAMTRWLQAYSRTGNALLLLKQLFPESFKRYPALSHPIWPEILTHILKTAEAADWFEVNWADFKDRLHIWESDEAENGKLLAYFLRHIPVKQYGFSIQTIHDYPLIELMYILLSDDKALTSMSSDLLIGLEVYDYFDDAWTEAERQAAWERLYEVERYPYRFPELVRMLPDLARWSTRTSGNPLLDNPAVRWLEEGVACRLGYHYRFSWGEIDSVRRFWQQAKAVLHQFDRLLEWSEQHQNALIGLFNFFAEGDYKELED